MNGENRDFNDFKVVTIKNNDVRNILIDSPDLILEFDPEFDGIKVPEWAEIREKKDKLIMDFDKNARIIIGTYVHYDSLEINAAGIDITGSIENKINVIDIDGSDITIHADIKAENLRIGGTDIRMNGNYQINNFEMDGSDITLTGHFNVNNMSVDGSELTIFLKMENAKNVTIDGSDITGIISYTDLWEETRYMNVDGSDGDLNVLVPEEAQGQLVVNHDGIRVNFNKY